MNTPKWGAGAQMRLGANHAAAAAAAQPSGAGATEVPHQGAGAGKRVQMDSPSNKQQLASHRPSNSTRSLAVTTASLRPATEVKAV